jgi:asparaginyl-tRNA synthetase
MEAAEVTSVKALLARGKPGESVRARGWLRTARHSKGLSFLDVSDGSCLAGVQVVCEPSLANFESEVRKLDTGCAVDVAGTLASSEGKEQSVELRAVRVTVVGRADADYPLQKKRHGFEFLRTIAHLRPRTNTLGAVLRVRNVAARAVHRFFQEKGFVWLHTPIITSSDAEGAGAMFRVTVPSHEGEFFGKPAFLTVSGQLEAEIGALALTNVYSFGPTFRAENSNTSRHLAEFWMIEPEMAFCDLRGDMALAEEFLRYVLRAVLDESGEDMAFFDERIQPGVRATLEHVASTEFAHLTYTEAIAALERSGESFEFPVKWGADLQSEHERWLTERHVGRPVIVTDYPKEIKAFYMYRNADDKTVRAMDVLVPKVGEIIGGSQREDRLEVLRARLAECGLDEAHYGWYLDLRRFGSVPHAGFGLGFERLMLYLTGMANIRDVIPFPRVPGYAEF